MADYSTIQQHEPLRAPSSFDAQGKAMVAQLEEILDDIYRRFGRLRIEDLGTKLRKRFEDDEGNIAEVIQTASSLITRMTTAEGGISEVRQTADSLSSRMSTAEGNISSIDQKADNISLRVGTVEDDINNQTTGLKKKAADLRTDVDNKYAKVSGIDILAAGITISGSQYVNILSGGYISIGSWTYDVNGLRYAISNSVTFKIEGNAFGGGHGGNGDARLMVANGSTGITTGWIMTDGGGFLPYSSRGPKPHIGDSSNKVSAMHIGDVNYDNLIQNSSRAVKHNIAPMEEKGERLDSLKPVTFVYNNDEDGKTRHGLIWEDTVNIMPEICQETNGEKTINYVELIPMLLKEIQSLRKRVAVLEAKTCTA